MSKDILSTQPSPSLYERAMQARKEAAALVAVLALSACASPSTGSTAEAAPDSSADTTSETVTTVVETPEPEPTETETTTVETESTVSIAGERGVPTAEQIETAKQGIPGELSPADAIRYAGDIMNIYVKSGDVSIVGTEYVETPESIDEGSELLEAIHGPYLESTLTDNQQAARLAMSGYVASSEVLHTDVDSLTQFVPDVTTLVESGTTASMEYDNFNDDNNDNPNMDGRDADWRMSATLIKDNGANLWYVVDQSNLGQIS